MAITHAKVSNKIDGPDETLVRPSDWNDDHVATLAVEFVIDGGSNPITTGVKGDLELPFSGAISRVTLLADQAGSIVVDIWRDSYANYPPTVADSIIGIGGTKPTLVSAIKAQDSTLTNWTKTFLAGDILRFNVDSATTVKRVLVSLAVTA